MTFPNITTRYPDGKITPAGITHLLRGDQPWVAYRSYDDQVVFNLMGPLAIWDRTKPESIRLTDLKGLIPPWQNIEQKGATQDGSTFITSLYDPMEIDITVTARGRDGAHTRKVIRDWIASWDAKKPGTLSWFTPDLGYWWVKAHWGKQPVDPFIGGNFTRQRLTHVAKVYDAFWRSYDSTDVFAYTYRAASDVFDYDTHVAHGLGTGWTIVYSGTGSGYLYADGIQCTSTLTGGHCAVARRANYSSVTDEQIITATIGPIDPWPAATDVYLDLWARMNTTGNPGLNGIRLRLGYKSTSSGGKRAGTRYTPHLKLSHFVGGTETVLREADVKVPWQPGDQIALIVGGYSGKLYSYWVQRGTNTKAGTKNVTWSTLMTVSHASSDGSSVGANYRGAGFGMQANGTALPPSIKSWTAGDSTAAEEAGYVTLYNVGDQPGWPYYILVGPGIFGIGDGPNATQACVYGPLEQNQMVLIRTDPRRYGVTDLTSLPPPGTPAPSAYISALESALETYASFLSNSRVPPPVLSVFGTPFPQGNPYSLLSGRFSRPIPAKQPGSAALPQQIAVAVEDGGPTTAILAGITPLRRWPG